MVSTLTAPEERQLLHDVPWHTYEFLLECLEGRHFRITYFHEDLEIMPVSHEHEFSKKFLGRLVEMLTFELDIAIHSGGSTTIFDPFRTIVLHDKNGSSRP